MKTSKKFLSLFLALVMIITSCSVGLTAFAADGNKTDSNNDYWSDGTTAEVAFDSLEDLANSYVPALLNIDAVKSLLEDNLGMTITDETTISDVVAGASPLILGLLGSSANKESIRNDTSAMADLYYSYLDDDNAVMDFYSLYQFCENNQNVGGELGEYCSKQLPALKELLDVYKGVDNNISQGSDIFWEYYDIVGEAIDWDYSAVTLDYLKNFVVDSDQTKLKDISNTYLDAYFESLDCVFRAVGSSIEINDIADALFYTTSDGMGFFQYIVEVYYGIISLDGTAVKSSTYGDLTVSNYYEKISSVYTYQDFLVDMGCESESDLSTDEQLLYKDYYVHRQVPLVAYMELVTGDYAEFSTDYYDVMCTNILTSQNICTKEDIQSYKITDSQLDEFIEYAENNFVTAHLDDGSAVVDIDDFATYINSSAFPFSEPVQRFFSDAISKSKYKTALTNFQRAAAEGNKDAVKSFQLNFNDDSKLNDMTFIEAANYMISSELLYINIDDTDQLSIDSTNVFEAISPISCITVLSQYYNCIYPETSKYQYDYDDYAIPNSLIVDVVNTTLNDLLAEYLAPGAKIAGVVEVNKIISALLESNITLYVGDGTGVLDDLWKNLYDAPIKTIVNLIPTLDILLDEVILPLFLHDDTDASLIELYSMLCTGDGILAKYTQDAGSEIGIGALSVDLNTAVPAILHWLNGDTQTAIDLVGTYTGDVYDNNVPKFTNIYYVDKALYGAHLNGGIAKVLINKGKDETLANGLDEIVTELAYFGMTAVDEYLADHATDARYSVDTTANIATTQKGLNNIMVALPQILDIMGKNFIEKYNIDSDWTYTYDGKITTIEKTFRNGTVTQLQNTTLQAFKDTATSGNPDEVLGSLVDTLIGNWINAVLDLLNDTLSDENNDITSKVPLIQGLLAALGGFGDTSIITDVVNGFFQLKRSDVASFTLTERSETGFVGFSNESGFFLLSNLQYSKDGTSKGIIPVVLEIINNKSTTSYNVSNAFSTKSKSPLLANKSAAGTDYSKLLSSQNTKAATELIDTLDELLSSLLANTSLNGFDFDSTDNILSAIATAASAYLGAQNTNDIVKLINNYLYYIVGENNSTKSSAGKIGTSPTKSGDVNKKKVYTAANLSNLVIQTYSLVENIVDYLFYNSDTGLLASRDSNMLVADALCGIISPDAVAVRLAADYEDTAKVLQDEDHLNWNSFKVEISSDNASTGSYSKNYLKFNFSNGDKTAFYDALGESLNGIAAIVGVILTNTYTDSTRTSNWYSEVVYPVVSNLADATGATGVMTPDAFNSATDSQKLIKGIVTPVSNILDQLYDAPVSFILNVVKGLAGVLQDSNVKKIVNGAIDPINNLVGGLADMLDKDCSNLSPTFANAIRKAVNISVTLPKKNIIVSLLNGVVGNYITLPNINWTKLANAKSPAEVLLLVYGYVVDTVLGSDLIQSLLNSLAPELTTILKKLSATQILTILNQVLAVVQSPTEVYWTFSEYASKLTGSFTYPTGITASEADDAVDQLDELVANVFPLLNGLGVTDIEGLGSLVNDNLYTNEILTKLATTVYGAIDNSSISDVAAQLGLDFSPSGIAAYLTDSSYGKTYSSAASTLKKAKSWSKVKSLNWGFKDGSAKAQTGFVNGLAAILRPFNDVLAIFLAEGDIPTTNDGVSVADAFKTLSMDIISTTIGSGEYSCKLKASIKKGIVTITVDSNVKGRDDKATVPSVFKIDLPAILEDLENLELNGINIGTNGYENAIIPILEAFMCDNVKTYKEYKADYKKAKDNLLINVLKPIVGFVDDVCDAPFDTITKVLPNVAYFIDSNGVAQAIGNLLAPITAENGILGVLDNNGLNVDTLIEAIAGKDLGTIVTDALGLKVDFNLELTHLEKCNIQDIVVPLVNTLLKKNGLNITVPTISFSTLASHGTVKTVKSAAKNDQGKYTTKQVQSDQGETLVAVFRYIADVLIKNASGLKGIICGIDAIKKNSTIANIVKSVFNQIGTASKDDIVLAVFYFLTEDATNTFFDYSDFKYDDSYTFTFGNMDEDFCRQLAPMLDGLVSGLVDLNSLVTEKVYTDSIISSIATGLYGAVEGVNISDDIGSLTKLLAMTDIDFTTANVANLLTDTAYGQTYESAASVIKSAGSWSKVNADDLKWGVTDRDSFLNALCAVLRPIYGVLDVILNDASLNLFDLVNIPGSDGYTSTIVPLLEAFGVYNIKTQYQYREDIYEAYDNILLDILNPLLDKVEDILAAPIEMVADILPNLSLFFANDGLLQIVENLLTPISALLKALQPIVDINDILLAAGLDVPALLKEKIGVSISKFDLYDLSGTLAPLVGADNVVAFLNNILGIIKISGNSLGIELPDIDWFQLASHGEFVLDGTSQAATFGSRISVTADQDETLIAVLRYLVNTINYKDNYNAIVNLITGLLGDNVSDSISGVIDQVLGMLQGDADTVIENLVDLLQSFA